VPFAVCYNHPARRIGENRFYFQEIESMGKLAIRTAVAVLLLALCQQATFGQDDINQRLQSLTQRVSQLESKESELLTIAHRETGGAAIFLFGAFCALWAQNTNRNAWLWFFMGLLFSVITVIVLLVKNSQDRQAGRGPSG
jgi:hypothetical protein